MQFTERESAKTLIQTLQKKGFSYATIASKTGVSEQTIRRWEKGKLKPHRLFVKEMKKILEEGK